jgi:hypothetical protein
LASTQTLSAGQIKAKINSSASRRTISLRISESPYFEYLKMKKKPPLKQEHKDARLRWAREQMTWDEEWDQILLSDEKNLTLMVLMVGDIIGTTYERNFF